jgi:hypothetical protein
MKTFGRWASIALICLLAFCTHSTASAQGRGWSRGGRGYRHVRRVGYPGYGKHWRGPGHNHGVRDHGLGIGRGRGNGKGRGFYKGKGFGKTKGPGWG